MKSAASSLADTPEPAAFRVGAPGAGVTATADSVRLIEDVMALRQCVGDGLNDAEFTCLMTRRLDCTWGGFSILCYSEGWLTLEVPKQDLQDWYSNNSWIHPGKEKAAREIAARHALTLCEPPDLLSCTVCGPQPRHHLEFMAGSESALVAHPLFVRLRLFSTDDQNRILWTTKSRMPPGGKLMKEMAGIYR